MISSVRLIAFRFIIAVAALVLWFWTQSLLGARPAPAAGIGDGLHQLTAYANAYLSAHSRAADALLILSSAVIDTFGLFLLCSWLLGKSIRPFLGLVLLIILRQSVQALCSLSPPPGMIWHYPGVPSLLVTYSVARDFFFSGHTAIAVFATTELARLRKSWLTVLGVLIALFEICAVIVLRAHYTMDVIAGIFAAFSIAAIVQSLSLPVDRALSRAFAHPSD